MVATASRASRNSGESVLMEVRELILRPNICQGVWSVSIGLL